MSYIYSKYHELEAKHCKVESKYMILLQETQEPKLGGCGLFLLFLNGCTTFYNAVGNDMGPSSELVSQMLEEALGSECDSVTKERSKLVSFTK